MTRVAQSFVFIPPDADLAVTVRQRMRRVTGVVS